MAVAADAQSGSSGAPSSKALAPSALAQSTLDLRWSRPKLSIPLLLIVEGALIGILLLQTSQEAGRIAGLVWLGAMAVLGIDLYRRWTDREPVIRIDACGIQDRRIQTRQIAWWEIDYVFPANLAGGRVVELRLRHPACTLRPHGALRRLFWKPVDGRLRAIGLPDVCIGLLLVDGTPTQIMQAIAQHRPDLLPLEHRAEIGAGACQLGR